MASSSNPTARTLPKVSQLSPMTDLTVKAAFIEQDEMDVETVVVKRQRRPPAKYLNH
ncbi:hypothetical protein [Candidatus Palauibacter sp.]|uniref:hypothetical protein n=1 Tax=Candidatus Palauibacter sp. TaxID=3101350 RepID=UPI003B5CCC3C